LGFKRASSRTFNEITAAAGSTRLNPNSGRSYLPFGDIGPWRTRMMECESATWLDFGTYGPRWLFSP
jgi:hypothetical protein